MSIVDHQGECEFPMSKELVFEALCKAIDCIDSIKLDSADKLTGRVIAKTGVSLFSWGENIPIQLREVCENKTLLQIISTPKTGVMFGGAFDMGKNRKNIELIISKTSQILQNK